MSPAFERSCAGCRLRGPRASLRRFVVADGEIVADTTQTMPGRGAYLCDACALRPSLANLRRALRAPGAILSLTRTN